MLRKGQGVFFVFTHFFEPFFYEETSSLIPFGHLK